MGTKKILIVDDEAFFLYGLGKALQSVSTEVTVVETGKSALQEIAATPYHICFLDVCLPDLDGVEILKRIKAISPRTKVIMMTAGVVTTAMQENIERDAYMFLPKPFDLLQVRMLIKGVLEETENMVT